MRHRACAATFAVALAGSATACSDPTTPNGVDGLLRMTVVSAPALSDTIQAWAPEPLVVVLRGEDGRPLAGMPVRFEAGAVDTLRPFERPLFLCRRSVTTCNATSQGGIINVIDTTDASGQVQVRVRYGAFADTGFVSVLPDGELAAFDLSRSARLVVQHLDGTILHRWPTGPSIASSSGPPPLSWSADGSQIVLGGELECGGQDGPRFPLQRIEVATGDLRPALQDALPFDGCASWGRLTRDGEWLYFGAAPWDEGWSLFRARADGTAIEAIGPARTGAIPWWEGSWRGDPGADGMLVVYQRFGEQAGIQVLDLATGTVTPTGVAGATPRLSPDGRSFAYVPVGGGHLVIAELANPGRSTLIGQGFVIGEHAFGWSADGNWLLASAEGGLHVIDVITGQSVVVPGTSGFTVPAWRP